MMKTIWCQVLLSVTLVLLIGCKSAEPLVATHSKSTVSKPRVPKPVKLVRVVDQSNTHWDKANDYGGTVVQTYRAGVKGPVVAARVALEVRENTRELLVTLRRVDEYGYPEGNVLASGVIDAVPQGGIAWYEATFKKAYHQKAGERLCLSFTPSSIKSEGYGYFQYAFSYKNKYLKGRLNESSRGRQIPQDNGKDLCFEVIALAKEGQKPESIVSRKENKKSQNADAEKAVEKWSDEETDKNDLAYKRLSDFLLMKHIPIRDMEGCEVHIWKYTRGQKYREPLHTIKVDHPIVDIFYGIESGDPGKEMSFVMHEVGVEGGGVTCGFSDFGAIQHMNVDRANLPIGKPVKLARNLKPEEERSFIWIQIDAPEKNLSSP